MAFRIPFPVLTRAFPSQQRDAVRQVDRNFSEVEAWMNGPEKGVLRGMSVEMDNKFGTSPVQTAPDQTFTTINFDVVNFNDGNFSGNLYTVPVTGVYSTVVRLRLPDNLPATFSYGAGVHTSNVDGPWFLWAYTGNSTLGSTIDRSSLQIARTKEFQAGDQLRAYCYIDRGAATNLDSAAFDVLYEGTVPE